MAAFNLVNAEHVGDYFIICNTIVVSASHMYYIVQIIYTDPVSKISSLYRCEERQDLYLAKFIFEQEVIACKALMADKEKETLFVNKEEKFCPLCMGKLVVKEGKFGQFYGCTEWPQCRASFNLNMQPSKQTEHLIAEKKRVEKQEKQLKKKHTKTTKRLSTLEI